MAEIPAGVTRQDYVLDGSPEAVALVRKARGLPPTPPTGGEESWAEIVAASGWNPVNLDFLRNAGVEAMAWNLLEQTMDTSDRSPSAEVYAVARATAERLLPGVGGESDA